jgi:hypothetical protein
VRESNYVRELDIYAKRYGLHLQEIIFGNDWIPDKEIDAFFIHLAYWIRYSEYVEEQLAIKGIKDISDDIRWNPEEFNKLIERIELQEEAKRKAGK